ncbi:Chemotaxis protein CheW [Pandoraea terrae]|uniref:Chemotaxis protein CheW n=1 Tax=Pandoraea terrae TaxID=1537710 RepID=A0A5E4XMN7_9BURK|nr:chemotaxis protein CheW [Pandoraea terrae]VVE37617.1 Chemotaxis protein CheW [Pandoraea terrae]
MNARSDQGAYGSMPAYAGLNTPPGLPSALPPGMRPVPDSPPAQSAVAVPDAIELYGSFHLGQTELALPVSSLQEVVNYPARVTPVPLAPSFLLGLFNLRGTLIPIVNLKPLLGIADAGVRATEKIAIVDHGGVRVGLLFDTTGEILRIRPSQKTDFVYGEGSPDAARPAPVIAGAIKLANGDRILQILSPSALVRIENMPHLLARQAETAPQHRRSVQGQRLQCVSFRVAHARLALSMSAIQEIIRKPELQNSAFGSEFCIGMLNLRGIIVPVIDFARFLDMTATPPDAAVAGTAADERRVLIVKQEDVHFGLLVDAVDSIVTYHAEELLAIPSFSRRHAGLFAGCIAREGGADIILLNPNELFTHDQVLSLTQGHRDLYRNAAGVATPGRRGKGARSGARQAYIAFRLDYLLGVRIDQLREIIHFSPDIIRAPGAPSFVRGMLNLRKQLVTIVDLRAIYGMKPYADEAHARILIIERGQEKFGLVVDAVENIVTIDEADKLPVPAVLIGQAGNDLRLDMREAVEIPSQDGAPKTLMLLDLAPLTERIGHALA